MDSEKAKMWTSAPGKVVSYNAAKQTVSVQLAVKSFVKKPDGSQEAVDIPVLEDVPVQFPGGGGQTMTFPVKPGDEVLVTFSSRSPDSWQQSGAGEGGQVPTDATTHSLSHGFAQLGYRSNPKALSNVSESATQIRSDDGNTSISLSGEGGVSVDTDKSVAVSAASGVSITGGAGNVSFTGKLIVNGDIELNGISLKDHKHTGVTPGGGTSTGPTN
jgi:phage baseplate assembly protein gpV